MTKEEQRAQRAVRAEMVRRYRGSGKSQRQFCEDEDVKPHVLSYWVSKSLRGAGEAMPRTAGDAGFPFIEITPKGPVDGGKRGVPGRIELTLPTGTVIRATGDIDEAILSTVIAAAKER